MRPFHFNLIKAKGKARPHCPAVLTVAVSYGLQVSQVLLLPFHVIAGMEKEATDEKNAYFVANFITSGKNFEKNERWIRKMLLETLCKILNVLINYHEVPLWSLVYDKFLTRDNMVKRNQQQCQAIIKILVWLVGNETVKEGINPTDEQIRKFQNTMLRIGTTKPSQQQETGKWQRYADNVMKVREFFMKAQDDPHQFKYDTDKPKWTGDYMDSLKEDTDNFMKLMKELTAARPIHESDYDGRKPRGWQRYLAGKTASAETGRYKRVEW